MKIRIIFISISLLCFPLLSTAISTTAFTSIQTYGAKGDGRADDSTALQNALDAGGVIVLPKGTYRITRTLFLRHNNSVLMGHGPYASIINYEGTGPAIAKDSAVDTLYWCKLTGLSVYATKNQTGALINWSSIQFGELENLWIRGSSTASSIGISLFAIPTKTEATYNKISHCYIGGVNRGIQFGYGANSNIVEDSRIQPIANGVGIYLKGSMSNNRIINNGFEYPNNVSGGILIDGGVYTTFIEGNRFEGLSYGWKITGPTNINTVAIANYYDSMPSTVKWIDAGRQTQNFDQPLKAC